MSQPTRARNKDRVFAAYYQLNNLPVFRPTHGPIYPKPGFHLTILILPKKKCGKATSYDVKILDGYCNIPSSGGWTYSRKSINTSRSKNLLGMLMIGKLPPDASQAQVGEVLAATPLPREAQSGTCRTWTEEAVRRLQIRSWAEQFDVKQFTDYAAKEAVIRKIDRKRHVKVSYVDRKFP